MAAKRKFTVFETGTREPRLVEVDADSMDVTASGDLCFVVEGLKVKVLARGEWSGADLVPVPGERPTRSRA